MRVILLLVGLAASFAGPAAGEVGADLARTRAALAATYMVTALSPHGHFGYEYDFVLGRFLDRDNIVRQAGAASAVAEYLARTREAGFDRRAGQAVAYHAERSVAFGEGRLVSADGTEAGGSAGATALALLAELFFREATGDDRFAAARIGWVNGLAALQNGEGGFRQSPDSEAESPYFNGETWLALAHYARLFPDDAEAAAMLGRADAHMMAKYTAAPESPFAHWGLMAASVRYETTRDPRFLAFLATLADVYMTRLRPPKTSDGNTCSMVEGLAAAARALHLGKGDPDLLGRVAARAEGELTASLPMQILPGQTSIRLGGERVLGDPNIAWFAGAFLNARFTPRARIDLTQHCLSALMKYEAYLRNR